jgi:sugar phosphate isomerase/epimerase
MRDRVGIATWLMGRRPLVERIRWAGGNGFTAVSFEGNQMAAEENEPLSDAVVAALGELDLAVTLHLSPHLQSSPERKEQFLLSVRRSGELCRRTGRVRCVSIDPAWKSGSQVVYDPDWTLEALGEIARTLDGQGVAIAVENWKINPDPAEFVRLDTALGGARLGLLLDVGHLHVMNEDTVAAVGAFPLPVREVHLSDNDGTTDEHLPLGRGTLPIDELVARLTDAGFDGVWTLELRPDYYMDKCCITRKRACDNIRTSRERLERALAMRGTT